MADPDLSRYSEAGTELVVRVIPKASRNRIVMDGEIVRVYVTTVPEGGKATAMVQKTLAKSIGIAKTRLVLKRGQTSRNKIFVVV